MKLPSFRKTIDYFFGFGYDKFKNEEYIFREFTFGQEANDFLINYKIKKVQRIIVKNTINILDLFFLYKAFKTGEVSDANPILFLESLRFLGHMVTDGALEDIAYSIKNKTFKKHQDLDEIADEINYNQLPNELRDNDNF
ncbi:hypothetical protein HOE04_01870 [archaeon]|jgi:hypothetical protein|nr:hypothetical protein [archaeon]